VVLKHLAVYPFDVLAMMLPWSPMLGFYALRDFRRSLAAGPRAQVMFLLVAIGVCFLPVWLPPGSSARYFMPLFPCVAILLGVIFERMASPPEDMRLRRTGRALFSVTGGVILAMAAMILVASWVKADSYLAQPKGFAALFFAAAIVAAGVLFHGARNPGGRCAGYSVPVVAAFIGLAFTGALTNQYVRYKVDIPSEVAAAKKQLPPGTKMVCLGYLHPVFAYYYGEPISMEPWPVDAADAGPDTGYFCFSADQHPDGKLPFAWSKIAAVRCDRSWLTPSTRSVVIGRRLDSPAQK
jgi:4-amino-4-deoxy-L-arabinose transferase-like glycosyltransferase